MQGDECKVVFTADEEAEARAIGYTFHTDTPEPKRRGRPAKVKDDNSTPDH